MWYTLPNNTKHFPLTIDRVIEIKKLNKQGVAVEELQAVEITGKNKEVEPEFVELVGQISLRSLEKNDRRRRDQQRNTNQNDRRPMQGNGPQQRNDQRPDNRNNRPNNGPNNGPNNRPNNGPNNRPNNGPNNRPSNGPRPNNGPSNGPSNGPANPSAN